MSAPVTESVIGLPAPRLRPYVGTYEGYRLSGHPPTIHAGLPSCSLTFIVAFDEPLDIVANPATGHPGGKFWAMLGGLHDRPAKVRHFGEQHGVQLDITPRGAWALFGVGPSELASQEVSLSDINPQFARVLIERLNAAAAWPARFAVLDEMLSALIFRDFDFDPRLSAAWDLLLASGGQLSVEDLANEVDWSRRHLSGKFRSTFGLTPKTVARVVRFERAQRLLRSSAGRSIADVAAECGYADQAHMTRQWHELAGSSPTAWLSGDGFPFVQDGVAAGAAK